MNNLRKYYILIFVFVFLIYGNSLKNKYALDDEIVTVTDTHRNPRIEKGLSGIPLILRTNYMESAQQTYDYRPVSLITFAVEYQIFKKNPMASHFINLLIYAATCLLLFFILNNILSGYHVALPFLITLFFTAHPLHTEVVDSLKNRDELLSFFFGLCSLYFALKYADKKSWIYVLEAAFFLWLGILSKKTAVVFIPIIPLTIYFFRQVSGKKIVLLAAIALLSFLTYAVFKRIILPDLTEAREFVFTENPLFYEHDFFKKIPVALYILGYYLKLMIVPYPLSAYYGYNTIPMADWSNWLVYVSFIIHTSALIFALFHLKKKTIIAYSIFVYLISIALYSNLFNTAAGIVAERFAYAASLGFCIFIPGVFFQLKKISDVKTSVWGFYTIWVVILVTFSLITIARNNDWKDTLTLFRNDVKNFDNSYNLHYIIGNGLATTIFNTPDGLYRKEMINEATFHYKRAAEIVESGMNTYPDDYISRNNLGQIYINYLNEPHKAEPLFKYVIKMKSNHTEANYNLAFCFEKQNKVDSAIYYYEKTIGINPEYINAYYQLEQLLISKSEYEKALQYNKKAESKFPENARIQVNMGNIYILLQDTAKAVSHYEKAITIEPENKILYNHIITFLENTGYIEKVRKLENTYKK